MWVCVHILLTTPTEACAIQNNHRPPCLSDAIMAAAIHMARLFSSLLPVMCSQKWLGQLRCDIAVLVCAAVRGQGAGGTQWLHFRCLSLLLAALCMPICA